MIEINNNDRLHRFHRIASTTDSHSHSAPFSSFPSTPHSSQAHSFRFHQISSTAHFHKHTIPFSPLPIHPSLITPSNQPSIQHPHSTHNALPFARLRKKTRMHISIQAARQIVRTSPFRSILDTSMNIHSGIRHPLRVYNIGSPCVLEVRDRR